MQVEGSRWGRWYAPPAPEPKKKQKKGKGEEEPPPPPPIGEFTTAPQVYAAWSRDERGVAYADLATNTDAEVALRGRLDVEGVEADVGQSLVVDAEGF